MANTKPSTSSAPRPAPKPEPVRLPPGIVHQSQPHPLPPHVGKDA